MFGFIYDWNTYVPASFFVKFVAITRRIHFAFRGAKLKPPHFASGVSECLANPRGVFVYSGCSIFPTHPFFRLNNKYFRKQPFLINIFLRKYKERDNNPSYTPNRQYNKGEGKGHPFNGRNISLEIIC